MFSCSKINITSQIQYTNFECHWVCRASDGGRWEDGPANMQIDCLRVSDFKIYE